MKTGYEEFFFYQNLASKSWPNSSLNIRPHLNLAHDFEIEVQILEQNLTSKPWPNARFKIWTKLHQHWKFLTEVYKFVIMFQKLAKFEEEKNVAKKRKSIVAYVNKCRKNKQPKDTNIGWNMVPAVKLSLCRYDNQSVFLSYLSSAMEEPTNRHEKNPHCLSVLACTSGCPMDLKIMRCLFEKICSACFTLSS